MSGAGRLILIGLGAAIAAALLDGKPALALGPACGPEEKVQLDSNVTLIIGGIGCTSPFPPMGVARLPLNPIMMTLESPPSGFPRSDAKMPLADDAVGGICPALGKPSGSGEFDPAVVCACTGSYLTELAKRGKALLAAAPPDDANDPDVERGYGTLSNLVAPIAAGAKTWPVWRRCDFLSAPPPEAKTITVPARPGMPAPPPIRVPQIDVAGPLRPTIKDMAYRTVMEAIYVLWEMERGLTDSAHKHESGVFYSRRLAIGNDFNTAIRKALHSVSIAHDDNGSHLDLDAYAPQVMAACSNLDSAMSSAVAASADAMRTIAEPVLQTRSQIEKEAKLWKAMADRDGFPKATNAPPQRGAIVGFTDLPGALFAMLEHDAAFGLSEKFGLRSRRIDNYFNLDLGGLFLTRGGSIDAYWNAHSDCKDWALRFPPNLVVTVTGHNGDGTANTFNSGDPALQAAL